MIAYRNRYGYPLGSAIAVQLWWRLEHLPYRGGEGGICGHITRLAYRQRRAWERRGAARTRGLT